MAGLRVVLACIAASVIAGCATLPEYRDDQVTTADVIRHIKCELKDAVWSYQENKWVRAWTAGLIFEFEVTHTGGLDSESTWVFPLNQGANFVVALTGGFSGQGTRTERMNFKVALSKLDGDKGLDCSEEDPGRHKLLGGRLGIEDILDRVRLTMRAASVPSFSQLDYNLNFVIKKNAGLNPRFNLIPIGKEKTFTGNLKWTGSYSDTQSVKITLTPPSDSCDFEDDHGCPAPIFSIVPTPKACKELKTEKACKGRSGDCQWVVRPDIDKCQDKPSRAREGAPSISSIRSLRREREIERGITRADEERNTSAETGNVLRTIEGELRRQRVGN